jgi:hypothetical protein
MAHRSAAAGLSRHREGTRQQEQTAKAEQRREEKRMEAHKAWLVPVPELSIQTG